MRPTILLIQPPIQDFYLTKKRTIPYGLISMAGSLLDHGFSVKLLDALATQKSRIIEPPQEMNYLQEFYGQEDRAPFSLFHHFRHYGYSFQHIGKLVKDAAPFLVGISSLFSPYAQTALETAALVKKVLPDCFVVMGGHHPTAMPAEVMACGHVDFVLRGDGETSMALLAEVLLQRCLKEAGKDKTARSRCHQPRVTSGTEGPAPLPQDGAPRVNPWSPNQPAFDEGVVNRFGVKGEHRAEALDVPIPPRTSTGSPAKADEACLTNGSFDAAIRNIPGIVFRQTHGDLYISPPATVDHLDTLAMPAASLLDFSFYQRGNMPGYVITASRGCPFNCSYCSVGKHSGVAYRRRTVPSVMREMKTAVHDFRVKFFDFEDENISFDRPWFKALLQAIIDAFGSGCLELRAMNGLFPPTLDDEAVFLMKKAGFRVLNLSLGTTSKDQLKRFSRPDVTNHFEQALMLARKHGLETVGYIIVGAPFQDPFDSVADLLYLASQQVLAGVSVFYPAPGSQDFELCRKRGLLPDKPSLYRSSALPVSHTTSRLDAVTLLRLGRMLNFLKATKDHGIEMPVPVAYADDEAKQFTATTDRSAVGIKLLQWFLHDGQIRGVTSTGSVYIHAANMDLTRRFINGLKDIAIRGCRES